jgi:hypothetical protein
MYFAVMVNLGALFGQFVMTYTEKVRPLVTLFPSSKLRPFAATVRRLLACIRAADSGLCPLPHHPRRRPQALRARPAHRLGRRYVHAPNAVCVQRPVECQPRAYMAQSQRARLLGRGAPEPHFARLAPGVDDV